MQLRQELARRERARVERDADAIRARCTTLPGFVREAWPVLEPVAVYKHGWHIDAICDHLTAITQGDINRLCINVPPGSMKSLLASVFWQAWEWGPMGMPSMRFLTTSFNDGPVKRDIRKTRDLIASNWFQTLWPDVQLVRAGETSFANDATGSREGVAFGSLTSQRGDRLGIDDPHSTETAESDAERLKTTRRFREGAQNRLNDQERSAILVIMQRLHMDDISGIIEQYGMPFERLIIPMEFDPARRIYTKIGWTDPRKNDGDLMAPDRWSRATVEQLKTDIGEYAYAGQYQQLPAPREGGLFKVGMIETIEASPGGGTCVRGWDLAGSKKKTSPYTVGLKLRRVPGRWIIEDVRRKRASPLELKDMLVAAAIDDGLPVTQSIPQDPAQAGKYQKFDLADHLSGHNFRFSPETGDKEARALPVARAVEAGIVQMVRGPWNAALLDELRNFPSGSFKDQVDALSRAFGELVGQPDVPANAAPEVVDAREAPTPADDEPADPWAAD